MELETYGELRGNRFTPTLNNSGQHDGVIVPFNIKLCQAMGVVLSRRCNKMKVPSGQHCGRVHNTMHHRSVRAINVAAQLQTDVREVRYDRRRKNITRCGGR